MRGQAHGDPMRPLVVALALLLLAPLAAAALPANVPVVAAGFSFASPALVVPRGTTVEWEGALLPHTVTSAASANGALQGQSDGRFRGDLPMGSSYVRTFHAAGTYEYFCELHVRLGMVGTIVVV